MEKKPKVGRDRGDSMPLCVSCKHGHNCPYMGEADLFHEIMAMDEGLWEKSRKMLDRMEREIRKRSGVTIGFDLGYDVAQCEKYKAEECREFRRN